MPPSRHSAYHALVEALGEGGCPVCNLTERSVRLELDSLAYEQVNDPAIRAELRAAQGFCRRHAWQLLQMGGTVFGVAILYADVLRAMRRRLPDCRIGRRADGSGSLLAGLLGSGRPTRREAPSRCPTCKLEMRATARFLETVAEHAADPAFQTSYEAAEGLCLPHLADVLERANDGAAAFLIQATERKLDSLLHDLDEFIRKHDYRFRHEGWRGREAEAPARAVRLAAGEPPTSPDQPRRRRPTRATSQGDHR